MSGQVEVGLDQATDVAEGAKTLRSGQSAPQENVRDDLQNHREDLQIQCLIIS